jgi:hypothetical protein
MSLRRIVAIFLHVEYKNKDAINGVVEFEYENEKIKT